MAERPSNIEPGERAPGYQRAPDHRVAFIPRRVSIQIKVGGALLGQTDDVVVIEEGKYPARYYLSRDGIRMDQLEKTDKVTFCPFKGLATYYIIKSPEGDVTDAVWSYEQPYLEGELIRDRFAFDESKVEQVVG